MIVLEVIKNGKPILHAGDEFVEVMHTSISCLKEKKKLTLSLNGLNEADQSKHSEFIYWLKAEPLSIGDEVRIRVINNAGEEFAVEKQYGNVISEDETTEDYCSFCGVKASPDVRLLLGAHANICHGCLKPHNPDSV